MTEIADLFPLALLKEALEGGFVRRQVHPSLPLGILNYTERAAYDRVWNEVTTQCRGLIYELEHPHRVVARPFPKFFNYGEPSAPELDLDSWARVTEKMDGSLGILYPTPCLACDDRGRIAVLGGEIPAGTYLCERCDGKGGGHAIATRGSFASDQALHATDVLRSRYAGWTPSPGMTYLFEIVYPENRIVCDYGATDDLFLLSIIDVESGWDAAQLEGDPTSWPGPVVESHRFRTLAEALAAEPRPNAEGLVVSVITGGPDVRIKIKQDDYVALHRILTGTNARHVWEVAAVAACKGLVHETNHWATYLGIDPARALEVLALGDDWLEGVPDEFYDWIRRVTAEAWVRVDYTNAEGRRVAGLASEIADRQARYEYVCQSGLSAVTEVMRVASAESEANLARARDELYLRAWRDACPEPTAPFARAEDVA